MNGIYVKMENTDNKKFYHKKKNKKEFNKCKKVKRLKN